MRTDLRSLEMLLAVAEHGSIGRAARSLGLRQPSVTDRIRNLERHLKLELVRRSPQGTTLTLEGVTVADWARRVLDASDRLEVGVAALRREHDSKIRVSASMTISEYLMPRWLSELHADASVSLRMCNSKQVAEDVLTGDADLGFVEGLRTPAGLHTRAFADDELVVVAAPRHPWARREGGISVAELAQAALVIREPGSGTREAFDKAVLRAGFDHVPPRLELGSTAAIKAAVLTGQGVGVLSKLTIAEDVAAGQLAVIAVHGIDLRRKLRMMWRSGSKLVGPAADLAACAARST